MHWNRIRDNFFVTHEGPYLPEYYTLFQKGLPETKTLLTYWVYFCKLRRKRSAVNTARVFLSVFKDDIA